MVKQKYLDKAEVLIEALPYIQRFNRKIIVVKYGGSAMVDEQLKRTVIQDVVLLKLVGFKPIIVHGGGKEISRWVSKVGKEPQFINGLRVTDEETMELAEMVLNKVNKRVCKDKEPSKFGLMRVGTIKNPHMLQMNRRVFSELGASPTLVTGSDSIPKIIQCKVRKLTPLECWRLVGFSSEDYWLVRKALEEQFYNGKDCTDTQMYKMAGNSIVIQVAESIIESLKGILY